MEEILEEVAPEEVVDQEILPEEAVLATVEQPVEEVEVPLEDAEPSAQAKLQEVCDILMAYGGSGTVDTVTEELRTMLEGHAKEVEQSEKTGRLTFSLSQIVHDAGAVLGLIDLDAVDFDPSNLADLRDFLEPIYQEKPYLFKVISPLRGAHMATGITGNPLPTNGELGALSMEEYTAYRNARGSVSR